METEKVLTCTEVAKLTGYDKETVRRWCREGTLPAYKLGQEWLIRRQDVPPPNTDRPVGVE